MSLPSLIDLCTKSILYNPSSVAKSRLPEELIHLILSDAHRKGLLDDHFLIPFLEDGHITHLNFEVHTLTAPNLTSLSLLQIGPKLHTNLISLNLSFVGGVTDEVLASIYSHCPNLKCLILKGCTGLTHDAFRGIEKLTQLEILHLDAPDRFFSQRAVVTTRFTHATFHTILGLPSLRELSLRKWNFIRDDALDHINKKFPQLNSLNITDCRRITDVGIEKLLIDHPAKFTSLDFSGLIKISDKSLECIGKHCASSLRSVVLKSNNKISDTGIENLLKSCPKINVINLAYLDNITNKTLSSLANAPCLRSITLNSLRQVDNLSELSSVKNLQILSCHEHPDITDSLLKNLSINSPTLQEVYLESCSSITDEGIEALASGCANLQVLFLGECPKFSDKSMIALGKNCSALTTLIVGRVRRGISDEGLMALANGCRLLKSLDLLNDGAYNPENPANFQYRHISDKAIASLAASCTQLSSLSLRYLGITDAALSNFHSLVYLNVRGCAGITAAGIQNVVKNCLNLQTITIENCPQLIKDPSVDLWRSQSLSVIV